jgi:GT2 family glycosyltransferase
MDLSIVILNYKQKGLVRQCIKGIVSAQPKLDYEIIVVDNNSGDGCLAMVNNFVNQLNVQNDFQKKHLPIKPDIVIPEMITIQSPTNDGFSAGNNLGIKRARGEYIMILNPDIAIVPDVLEKMCQYMKANPKIGILGPKLINPDGSAQYSCRRFPSLITPAFRRTKLGSLPFAKKMVDQYLMKDFDQKQTRTVDWLFGACLLVRKSVFEKVGLFDERFFMYFEDLDLCRRVWHGGYEVVYYTDVEVVHYHHQFSAVLGGIKGIFSPGGRIHIASGLKYFLKYRGQELPKIPLDK